MFISYQSGNIHIIIDQNLIMNTFSIKHHFQTSFFSRFHHASLSKTFFINSNLSHQHRLWFNNIWLVTCFDIVNWLVNQLNNGFLNLNLHKSFDWSINLPPFKVEGCCKPIGKLTETGVKKIFLLSRLIYIFVTFFIPWNQSLIQENIGIFIFKISYVIFYIY